MWPLLQNKIAAHVSLTSEEYEVVASCFTFKKYKRKQYILQEGDICRHETFILKGCVRIYEINDKGQEHILQFGIEGWWVGNLYSFSTETASLYNIDCLEECEIVQITKKNLELLYENLPSMERYFRIIIQNAFISFQHRVMILLARPAAERYKDFLERYPQIEERVPDHMIASYLGVTPQSLSRIRSNYSGK